MVNATPMPDDSIAIQSTIEEALNQPLPIAIGFETRRIRFESSKHRVFDINDIPEQASDGCSAVTIAVSRLRIDSMFIITHDLDGLDE